MQIDLSGRNALITGASNGLGRAVAHQLAASGADVAILARGADALQRTAADIEQKTGRKVAAMPCDVTDEAAIDRAVDEARAALGPIGILVNNAGSSFRAPFMEQTRDGLMADLSLKLFAAVRLGQRVVPDMKAARWGRIINVISIAAKAPGGGGAPTTLSRSAGLTLTKTMAFELAPDNILVNALCVGKIKSGQWERRHAETGGEQTYEEFLAPMAAAIPLGRVGEPEEFARVACFLASDAASYVTGIAINVDGGMSPVA